MISSRLDDPSHLRRAGGLIIASVYAVTWFSRLLAARAAPMPRYPGGKRRVGYDVGDVDVLCVVDGDLNAYLIPFAQVAGQTAVTLRGQERWRAGTVQLSEPAAMAANAPSRVASADGRREDGDDGAAGPDR